MLLLEDETLNCPSCTADFTTKVCKKYSGWTRQSTDGRHEYPHNSPLAYLIITCPVCGFTNPTVGFTDDDEREYCDFNCRLYVLNSLKPRLGEPVTQDERYEIVANLSEVQGRGKWHISRQLLCAAWCAEDVNDLEAARYYRLKMAAQVEQALLEYDEISSEQRGKVCFALGECWRRIGDAKKADRWLRAVEGTEVDPWLRQLAQQQLTFPQDWV